MKHFSFYTIVGLVWVIGALALGLRSPAASFGGSPEYTLEAVYERNVGMWPNEPSATLHPDGKKIYIFQGTEVQVLDWQSRTVISASSYADLPCESDYRNIHILKVVPGRAKILASYCSTLLILNEETLRVQKQFFFDAGVALHYVELSPDGNRVAVHLRNTSDRDTPESVMVLDTTDWSSIREWPISHVHSLSFHGDGDLLAIEAIRRPPGPSSFQCGVVTRRISTGNLESEWWLDGDSTQHCPDTLKPLPGSDDLIVTSYSDVTGKGLELRNLLTGIVRKHISSPRKIYGFLVSPDGSLAICDIANDPEDSPGFTQDILIWDLRNGELVYESPKYEWSIEDIEGYIEGSEGSWIDRSELTLRNISKDGRYFLITRPGKLVLLEIIAH